jgi:2-C-methyl-D-erythritol 4-phosphate cytidylyltransferase
MIKYAIIVAGGMGSRMGGHVPKQFMMLGDKPVLYYSTKTFFEAFDDIRVVIVLPVDYLSLGQEMADEYFPGKKIRITGGGDTRFHSVKNGLSLVKDDSIVFVHDGVRCLLTPALIHRCYDAAVLIGTAIPAIASRDSIRLLTDTGTECLDRNNVMLIQTPQTFKSDILLPAFETEYKEEYTDEASVVEAYGIKVSLVEGEENNIKITRPVDLLIADGILEERSQRPEVKKLE